MTKSIHKVVIFGLCVLIAAFIASPIQAQEQEKDKVKLTEAGIKELFFKSGAISFGLVPQFSLVWATMSHGDGKRDIYYRNWSDPVQWTTDISDDSIVGDRLCEKWSWSERCLDIYRVGEDKYESWSGGNLDATYYRLK